MHLRVFSSLSSSERRQFVDRYLSFLRDRDGALDRVGRRLSKRDQLLAELAAHPVRRSGPRVVEQCVYDKNAVEQRTADPDLDPWTLWAVCLSKGSRMEEYAVRFLEETGRSKPGLADDPYTFIDFEERYHSRLLESLLQIVDIQPRWRPPGLLSRLTLRAIVAMPKAIANITVLCGELIGVATFKLFLETGRKLCADQPQARERLEFLMKQILIDELGHVLFLRSQLGPIRLSLARALLPIISRVLIADLPEARRLFGRRRLLDEISNPLLLQEVLDDVEAMPLLAQCAAVGSDMTREGLPQA